MAYTRDLEQSFSTQNCLANHAITASLRARMVDWMIEVLTNFKCDDQTFFSAVSLLDRYLKKQTTSHEITDLHLIGVTCMYIACKYEDIQPLKIKMVHEKIAHKKLTIEEIRKMEMKMMKIIEYRLSTPSVLDFLKVYLKEVLDISHLGNTSLKKEEKESIPKESDSPAG